MLYKNLIKKYHLNSLKFHIDLRFYLYEILMNLDDISLLNF